MNYLIDWVLSLCEHVQESQLAVFWRTKNENELWYDLAFCLLSSQVPDGMAQSAVSRLKERGVTGEQAIQMSCASIAQILNNPTSSDHYRGAYRFSNLRARLLKGAASQLYAHRNGLRQILAEELSVHRLRMSLIESVPGIGPKQSSLFLRDIGYSDDLAVLDVHVMRYLQAVGLLVVRPIDLASMPKYAQQEQVFLSHAKAHGYSAAVFDCAVWLVMKAAHEVQMCQS